MSLYDTALDFFFSEGSWLDGLGDFFTEDLWEADTYSGWFGGDTASTVSDTLDKTEDAGSWYDSFSDPRFLGAAITTLPALISGLSAPDPQDEINRQQGNIEEDRRISQERFDQTLALQREQIAAQSAATEAAREAATKRALSAANGMFSQAQSYIFKERMDAVEGQPELINDAYKNSTQAAQVTGAQATKASGQAAQAVQTPALMRAK